MENNLREVTLFSPGDSRLLSTWSSISFFAKTLEKKGIIVNGIDISINKKYEIMYNKTILMYCLNSRDNYDNYITCLLTLVK